MQSKKQIDAVEYEEKLIKKKWLPCSDEEPNDGDDDEIQNNKI